MDFDFSFFLVLATFITGIIWGGYILMLRIQAVEAPPPENEPLLVEYARSFFPIVLIVLLLRSFLVEPFRIPSGSMMPTLLVGDFILVNKFTYGIRLPVINTKIVEMGKPQRGDIVVFRYPKDPTVDYIKRIVGMPGDRIGYYHKQVFLNGEPVKQTALGPDTTPAIWAWRECHPKRPCGITSSACCGSWSTYNSTWMRRSGSTNWRPSPACRPIIFTASSQG